MKKHKEKIKIGIVIGVFSVVIIACLVSIFSQVFTEYTLWGLVMRHIPALKNDLENVVKELDIRLPE